MTSPPVVEQVEQVEQAEQPVHRCGALLEHLARRLRLRSESVLAPLGLRPRHLVALTVLRARGGSTQQALASTLEMDGTNVVGLLNDLEAEKLIERRRSPEDRRRHIVELTEAGAERLTKAECALAAVEDEVLGALDHDQRETLFGLLQQVATRGVEAACVEADTGSVEAACVAADAGSVEAACVAEAAAHDEVPPR